jgi:hypothetical protein
MKLNVPSLFKFEISCPLRAGGPGCVDGLYAKVVAGQYADLAIS